MRYVPIYLWIIFWALVAWVVSLPISLGLKALSKERRDELHRRMLKAHLGYHVRSEKDRD